ncbi:MAG: Crp/Fnr family transcriptional regulator [Verrucomicrobia bacterium]|nr:Crp/Fnr family transcriptional regulator [Verrucomicrobiota bacterium]
MSLLAHPFFTYFSEAHTKVLGEYAEEFFCDEKTPLFQEGDPSDHVYLLIEGDVELLKQTKDGRQVSLGFVKAGDHFGEMGILDDKPRSASAVAASFVHVAKIPSTVLLRILNEEPAYVTIQLLKTILEHLRKSNERFAEGMARSGAVK